MVEFKNVYPVAENEKIAAGRTMTKAISILLMLAMVVQIIRPLGFPGLKRRMDFWKLAVLAFVIWTIALLAREFF